ncbi:hypothetical protein PY650_20390 [Rhizobium calliandrae]|uniref:Uncharacterized protein n=1 Tax=Rhizobium calliandrae TaxID=1312182 RepID=A0ABT7KH69_9HYPH|nr:hypothetical protein [Rhizobium calliandrae]MDL2407979.1 hypothetical protein [Rhizobium calliandrae]
MTLSQSESRIGELENALAERHEVVGSLDAHIAKTAVRVANLEHEINASHVSLAAQKELLASRLNATAMRRQMVDMEIRHAAELAEAQATINTPISSGAESANATDRFVGNMLDQIATLQQENDDYRSATPLIDELYEDLDPAEEKIERLELALVSAKLPGGIRPN